MKGIGCFVLDFLTDVFNERTNLLLKGIKIGPANEIRAPEVDYTVDGLIHIFDHECNKKENGVACHNSKLMVVDCRFYSLVVAGRDLDDGLDNISKVAGSYNVSISISLETEYYQAQGVRTGKQEAQRPSITITFI